MWGHYEQMHSGAGLRTESNHVCAKKPVTKFCEISDSCMTQHNNLLVCAPAYDQCMRVEPILWHDLDVMKVDCLRECADRSCVEGSATC